MSQPENEYRDALDKLPKRTEHGHVWVPLQQVEALLAGELGMCKTHVTPHPQNADCQNWRAALAARASATTPTPECKECKEWKATLEMYQTAWMREIGGFIVRKSHQIDGFVLRTRAALKEQYEKGKQDARDGWTGRDKWIEEVGKALGSPQAAAPATSEYERGRRDGLEKSAKDSGTAQAWGEHIGFQDWLGYGSAAKHD